MRSGAVSADRRHRAAVGSGSRSGRERPSPGATRERTVRRCTAISSSAPIGCGPPCRTFPNARVARVSIPGGGATGDGNTCSTTTGRSKVLHLFVHELQVIAIRIAQMDTVCRDVRIVAVLQMPAPQLLNDMCLIPVRDADGEVVDYRWSDPWTRRIP